MMSQRSEAAELIENIRETYGMTNKGIAEMLGRDEKMVRKVRSGEVPGTVYVEALQNIYDNGTLNTPQPPRARTKSGKLVKVRGKRGQPSVTPNVNTGKYVDLPKRGRAEVAHQYLAPGSRRSTYAAPKTPRAKGRKAINEQIRADLRREAKGQRHGKKRVKFEVITASGRKMPVGAKGGYSMSAALKAVNAHGGEPLDWMSSQIADRYTQELQGNTTIVGWQMTTYYAGNE